MEGIARLVSESLARHGFDRPLDYRRLHWSHWYRCESPHSLLFVPSKPGVFALAEEIADLAEERRFSPCPEQAKRVEGAASSALQTSTASAAEDGSSRHKRMLAVTQFFHDDDMAFVLDRMLSNQNPMRARLISGRYFVRYVVIEDEAQRRSVCSALNQWIAGASEQISGIGAHFATSLEFTDVGVGRTLLSADASACVARAPSPANVSTARVGAGDPSTSFRVRPEPVEGAGSPAQQRPATAPQLDSTRFPVLHRTPESA